jgi:hypothetical protein
MQQVKATGWWGLPTGFLVGVAEVWGSTPLFFIAGLYAAQHNVEAAVAGAALAGFVLRSGLERIIAEGRGSERP